METIIYIRTSTEEQNPENQLKDCLSINKYNEYELIEEQQSAWKDSDREGFNKLLSKIKGHSVKHLIVWDLDRVYRNRKNLISFFKLCDINHCSIHSYRQQWLENINSIQPPFNEIMHNLMLEIMGWLAEEESDKKSERVKAAIRIKEGGTFSYKGNKWGRKGLSNKQVDSIKELRDKGMSMHKIAKEMNISVGVVHKTISNSNEENMPENSSSSKD